MNNDAVMYLKRMLGSSASFREGQLECIEDALNRKKVLIVQKTGWGKSIVYFIATKILRDKGYGPTILISPLISLMRNQVEMANKINIKSRTINSSNNNRENNEILEELAYDKIDVLLISPERLANSDFMNFLNSNIKNIGMFVIDEAHCISDWGHDFRPDYQRIINIVNNLYNVPVLATTATANDRVIEDINNLLSKDIVIRKGSLLRESLNLQVIKLNTQAERMAWLFENIERIDGTGIIYCTTVNDCERVAGWLRLKGINAKEYHSRIDKDERKELENDLLNNRVKALIATVALGMGFDKPDLSFVIHFQKPGSIVSYYQQIGRAGRNIEEAYIVLLCGKEDDDIQEYFIKNAFPTHKILNEVVSVLEEYEGLNLYDILKHTNLSFAEVKKSLKHLLVDNIVYYENRKYFRSTNRWEPDYKKSERITKLREDELKKMNEFIDCSDCYMKFISDELNDNSFVRCNKCTNCTGRKLFDERVKPENIREAQEFLKSRYLKIQPRKKYPDNSSIIREFQLKEGRILSVYNDAGWGRIVKEDKYNSNCFSNDLIEASYKLIKKWNVPVEWVTSVPSLREESMFLVENFSKKLAARLKLPYYNIIKKVTNTRPQKEMENSYMQYNNIKDSFSINGLVPKKPVLLIDDMVDSRWTLTVTGILLKKSGSGDVYPFALAATTKGI